MHQIGDKVVYPMHGGAIIKNIVVPEGGSETTKYYVLEIMCSDLVVNVPVAQAESLGMRQATDVAVLDDLIQVLQETPDIKEIKAVSWNRRQQLYNSRLKTGDILEVGRVYKLLWLLDREKRISVGERRLLRTTKRIIQTELMLMRHVEEAAAEAWLLEMTK